MPSSTKTRVVIADFDPKERKRVADVVDSVGRDLGLDLGIDQASDGTTALAMCSDRRPHLLLTEIMLEGLSGLELLRRLRAEQGDKTAVVFLTALSRDSDRYWGLRNGAHAYIAKPYDDGMLRDRVRRILQDPDPPKERLV